VSSSGTFATAPVRKKDLPVIKIKYQTYPNGPMLSTQALEVDVNKNPPSFPSPSSRHKSVYHCAVNSLAFWRFFLYHNQKKFLSNSIFSNEMKYFS
jgi:hypothetical protein